MKKFLCMLLALIMLLSMVACGSKEEKVEQDPEPTTVGTFLRKEFKDQLAENADLTAQELADALLASEHIAFGGAAMPVEPGLLMGFDNAEITGFSEGVMFAPMIGTIPFIGYVFVLEEDADVEAFVKTLEDNANPRWNVCTEAEETVTGSVGNKVFFVMCPTSMEE